MTTKSLAARNEQAEEWERTWLQIRAHFEEFGKLSKSKPDAPANEFKVRLINEAIDRANAVLGPHGLPLQGFSRFEADALPSNSDIVVVLAQYLAALGRFHQANVDLRGTWVVDGQSTTVRSCEPGRHPLV